MTGQRDNFMTYEITFLVMFSFILTTPQCIIVQWGIPIKDKVAGAIKITSSAENFVLREINIQEKCTTGILKSVGRISCQRSSS